MTTKIEFMNQWYIHHDPITTIEDLKDFITKNVQYCPPDYSLHYQYNNSPVMILCQKDIEILTKCFEGQTVVIHITPNQPNPMTMSHNPYMSQYSQQTPMQYGFYPPPPPHPMHHPYGHHGHHKGKWEEKMKCKEEKKQHKREKMKKFLKEEIKNMIPELVQMIDEYKSSDKQPRIDEERKQSKNTFVHHGYVCDGCNMSPIIGDRYKCSVTEDFDYCQHCEATKEHPYPFLKIKTSKQAPKAIMTIMREEEQPKQQQQQQQQEQNINNNPNHYYQDGFINEDQFHSRPCQVPGFMRNVFENVQEQLFLNNSNGENPIKNFINQVKDNIKNHQNEGQQGQDPISSIIGQVMGHIQSGQFGQQPQEQQAEKSNKEEEKQEEIAEETSPLLKPVKSEEDVEIKSEKDESFTVVNKTEVSTNVSELENKIIEEVKIEEPKVEEQKPEVKIEEEKPEVKIEEEKPEEPKVEEKQPEEPKVEEKKLKKKVEEKDLPKVRQDVQIKAQKIVEVLGGEEQNYYQFVQKHSNISMNELVMLLLQDSQMVNQYLV